ncbi:hypothetical protein [Acidisarcina polymorpha]|uniref:hypothetical protein n=1 Tax=Acidisarcina polymorpha TaxID=2211140 RepID=UPI000DEF925F|nr:hypothetical protein [Acidisarcina polymorpha]
MTITNTFKDLAGDLDVFAPKQVMVPQQAPSPVQIERLAEREGFTINNLPPTRKALKSGRVASKTRLSP